MKKLVILMITSLLCLPAQANAVEPLKISQPGDLEMSCDQITAEANRMRTLIQKSENALRNASFNSNARSAAGTVGSIIVGASTAGLGLAAAGFIGSYDAELDEDKAESVQDVAHQRRAFLVGIHKAKSCDPAQITKATKPIKKKSFIAIGAERIANLEPSSGDTDDGLNK